MLTKIPRYLQIMIILTITNLGILVIRNLIVGDSFFNFIKSNLFIGSLPVVILAIILERFYKKMPALLFWFIFLLWVLFYPNAPYMISDLIHNCEDPTDKTKSELIKYDTMILFSFAMLSIYYGFVSLKIISKILTEKYNKYFSHITIIIVLILSCLGFYMGRELLSAIKLGNGYLYSWEIFLEPKQIIEITYNALFPVEEHLSAYALMILFGIIQYMMLLMFKTVNDIEKDNLLNPFPHQKNK